MDRFDADVMEDLAYDGAEGPARLGADDYDGYDEGDEAFDGFDEGDEGDDEFLGRLIGGIGRIAGGLFGGGASEFDEGDEGDEYDGFDAMSSYDEGDEFDAADGYDEGDGYDAMEDAVADAMDAGDGDEFLRRLRRVARTVGRGIGQAARVVGPIASMIPIPQAQLIGRIANVAGRLMADGADEFEAFDDLVDGLDEDGIDAAAPVLAGLVLRRALPTVARAAPAVRRAAVRTVARAVRAAARTQGAPAARAVARAVAATRRTVQRRGVTPRQAVRVVQRATRTVVRRPAVVRRLSRPLVAPARRTAPRGPAARAVARVVAPVARRAAAVGAQIARRSGGTLRPTIAPVHGGACPHCRGRTIRLCRPVTLTIR